ncbi:MAG: HNH endonuclease [Candidatus Hodarchaeales archaeon]
MQRASFRCQKCKRQQATQVHHLTYDNLRDKNGEMGNEPLSDLLAVCASCHRKIHNIKDKPRRRQIFGSLGRVLESD